MNTYNWSYSRTNNNYFMFLHSTALNFRAAKYIFISVMAYQSVRFSSYSIRSYWCLSIIVLLWLFKSSIVFWSIMSWIIPLMFFIFDLFKTFYGLLENSHFRLSILFRLSSKSRSETVDSLSLGSLIWA